MKCDYNKITLYTAGEFNRKYKTYIWNKVRILPLIEIENSDVKDSFLNSDYKWVETLEPLVLYRTFGRYSGEGSYAAGAFATTEFAESIIDVKERLALLPIWRNTKMYEAKFIVPSGEKFYAGIAAPQVTASGTVLKGGAEQIYIPDIRAKWDEWVCGYRRITSRQLDEPPEYMLGAIKEEVSKEELYSLMCPKCTFTQIEKLRVNDLNNNMKRSGELFFKCCNPECGYQW